MQTPSQPPPAPSNVFQLRVPQMEPTLHSKAAMQQHTTPAADMMLALRDAFPKPPPKSVDGLQWWSDTAADGDIHLPTCVVSVDSDKTSAFAKAARTHSWRATGEDRAGQDEGGFKVATHFVYGGVLGGILLAPPTHGSKFHTALVTDFHNGVYFGVSENKTPLWAAYVDLDFKCVLSARAVVWVARICHMVVASHFPTAHRMDTRCIVCTGSSVSKRLPKTAKTGLHIVWCNVVVDMTRQVRLAYAMRVMLHNFLGGAPHTVPRPDDMVPGSTPCRTDPVDPPPDPKALPQGGWKDVVDMAVYAPGRGLRLPYCPKIVKCHRKASCVHSPERRRASGRFERCPCCRDGKAPDLEASTYVPAFMVLAPEVGGGSAEVLVPTQHMSTNSRFAASATLLALCSIRRPKATLPSPGFTPPLPMQEVPDSVWHEARCAPSGAWLGDVKRPCPRFTYTGVLPVGPSVHPGTPAFVVVSLVVRTAFPRFSAVPVHSVTTYLDAEGRTQLYQVHTAASSANKQAHACANVAAPHSKSTVHFIIHGKGGAVEQRCTCKKSREGLSGKTCFQYKSPQVHLPADIYAALFPHQPCPARGTGHDVLQQLQESMDRGFLDATCAQMTAAVTSQDAFDAACLRVTLGVEHAREAAQAPNTPLAVAPRGTKRARESAPRSPGLAPRSPRDLDMTMVSCAERDGAFVCVGHFKDVDHLVRCLTHQQYDAGIIARARDRGVIEAPKE